MKSLKSKVIASAAMLLVAAVMMTSSSFAWYTISQQGELEQVKVKMEATDNLEIAKATAINNDAPDEVDVNQTGKEQYYGSKITASTVHTLDIPATITSGAVQTPVYASDGRLGSLQNATASEMEDDTDASDFGYYYYKANNEQDNCAVVYGFWLRSNEYETANLAITQSSGAKATPVVRGTDGTIYANGESVPVDDEGLYYELVLYYEGAGTSGIKAKDIEDGLAQETVTLTFTPPTGS